MSIDVFFPRLKWKRDRFSTGLARQERAPLARVRPIGGDALELMYSQKCAPHNEKAYSPIEVHCTWRVLVTRPIRRRACKGLYYRFEAFLVRLTTRRPSAGWILNRSEQFRKIEIGRSQTKETEAPTMTSPETALPANFMGASLKEARCPI